MSSTTAGQRPANNNTANRRDGDRRTTRAAGSTKNDGHAKNHSSANHSSKSNRSNDHQNHNNNNHSAPKAAEVPKKPEKPQPQLTQEQQRIASLMNEKTDLTELAEKVRTLMTIAGIDEDAAVVALHDCDGDLQAAADKILVDDFKNDFIDPKAKKVKNVQQQNTVNERETNRNGQNRTFNARGGRGASRGGRGGGRPDRDNSDRPRERRERPPREERNDGDQERDGESKPERQFKPRTERGRGVGGINRGRGSRTFVNNSRPPVTREVDIEKPVSPQIDTLGDTKIGTWEPTDGSKPAAAPISHLTVGNWSDVVREDLSEDEATSGKITTATFFPSGKTLREDVEPTATPGHDHTNRSPHQPTVMDQSRQAGAQLLQSLKQPSAAPAPQSPTVGAVYGQSASESLKSLVGISNAGTFQSQSGKPQTAASTLQQQAKKLGPSRIPASAVEMPSNNDPVTSLGVQFGALEVDFDAHGRDITTGAKFDPRTSSDNNKPSSGQQQHASILGQGVPPTDDRTKGYPKAPNDTSKSSELYQGGQQQVSSTQESYAKPSGPAPGYGQNAGYANNYNTNTPGNTYNAYQQNQQSSVSYGQAAANNSGNFASAASNKGQLSSSLGEFQDRNAASQKSNVQPSYGDLTAPGFINSTQTTNVIKNSLPATGKGQVPNLPAQMAAPMHPLHHPASYFNMVSSPVGITPFYAPLYDPAALQAGGRADMSSYQGGNAPAPGLGDSKYSRSSQDDVHGSSSVTSSTQSVNVSQAAGQHSVTQQPFINMPSFPPGYGFYYMPQPNMFQAQGTPFVPVATASNSTGAGGGNLFGKGNTGYTSYGPSTNSYDNSNDGYKQQQQQQSGGNYGQQRNTVLSGSDLMGSGGPGSFGKQSTQGSAKSSYDKMNQYQNQASSGSNVTSNVAGTYNMTGTAAAYQGAPYSMVGHPQQQQQLPASFQEAQNQSRSNQRNQGQPNKGYNQYNW